MIIKHKLKGCWLVLRYLCDPEMRRICQVLRASHLFDQAFYRKHYPDVAALGIDPLIHYLLIGAAELRQPNPYFDVEYYCGQVSALKVQGGNPLLHYLQEGWRKEYCPNPYFLPLEYEKSNPDVDFSSCDPLGHYISTGAKLERAAGPYFDIEYYQSTCSLNTISGDPLLHFLQVGSKEGRQPSRVFDPGWYRDKYAIDSTVINDVFKHYHEFGTKERKSPSPLFDPEYYEKTYGLTGERDLFRHYLNHAGDDSVRPNSWFDPAFYKKEYLSLTGKTVHPPFVDYLSKGIWQGMYPNQEIASLPEKPLLSILVPVYDPTAAHLNTCIRSVLYQSYPHWQLCLADDCSTKPHVKSLLQEWAAKDERIRVVFLEQNLGIAGASNAAATLATGEFLGFLDNDDELDPECLAQLVKAYNGQNADLYYTDEDLVGADGRRFSIFAKPDFNEELLLCHNYITHFVLTRRELFTQVGGCDGAVSGAQDYDLFLKLSEKANTIVHLPRVLYHWRASATSTSINHTQKEYANEAGRNALAAACLRRGIAAEVLLTELKYFYRVKIQVPVQPKVSVVIWWNRDYKALDEWLQRLEQTAGYQNFSLTVLFSGELSENSIPSFTAGKPVRWQTVLPSETRAEAYTKVSQQSDGELLVFIDGCLTEPGDGWLDALVEYGLRAEVGVVGGRIRHLEQGCEQELSPIPDLHNLSPKYFADFIQECSILMNGLQCPQQVLCVSTDFFMIKAESLVLAGGFAEDEFPELFMIHDLCYRLHEKGLKNIYTPYAHASRIYHDGRHTQSDENSSLHQELQRFRRKWCELLRKGDPFFTNLLLMEHGISEELVQGWLLKEVLQ